MASRDRRSLLEIRRLAYRAGRSSPEAAWGRADVRAVLHDALLETFPFEYPDVIRRADNQVKRETQRMARLHQEPWRRRAGVTQYVTRYVIFHPSYLRYVVGPGRKRYPRWHGKKSRASILFSIIDPWRPLETESDVLVYETKAPIRFR